MNFERKLEELGVSIPNLPKLESSFVPAVISGNLVFVSGNTPTVNGKLKYLGKLGKEVSLEQGQDAARLAVINCLAALRQTLGSLDRVTRIVKLNGYVASGIGFNQQPLVINGASNLLKEIFGTAGEHARAAIGVAELPGSAPVEIELVVEVQRKIPLKVSGI
ncbi:MAG: RidA family protein [Bacillota bacterium]